MPDWSVAAAQSASFAANIDKNIEHHLKMIAFAAPLDIDYLLFPELSL
ncbi:MAG: hypothetical protein XXXJIFNMEKO3_01231 [Candidatus Erwinia impunctatus]|nr:hypothetical protein XXXJIFNMEKO_01231 [Culicoides impunctatus]